MRFDEYQRHANSTNSYPPEAMLSCLVFGLCSEAGEVADKLKKFYRDGGDPEKLRSGLIDELGDVLWYVSQLAAHFESDIHFVAARNIAKLADRQNRGKIGGSGDDR